MKQTVGSIYDGRTIGHR